MSYTYSLPLSSYDYLQSVYNAIIYDVIITPLTTELSGPHPVTHQIGLVLLTSGLLLPVMWRLLSCYGDD